MPKTTERNATWIGQFAGAVAAVISTFFIQRLDAVVTRVGDIHGRDGRATAHEDRWPDCNVRWPLELPFSGAFFAAGPDEFSCRGELLDPVVGIVRHPYVALGIGRRVLRLFKLAFSCSFRTNFCLVELWCCPKASIWTVRRATGTFHNYSKVVFARCLEPRDALRHGRWLRVARHFHRFKRRVRAVVGSTPIFEVVFRFRALCIYDGIESRGCRRYACCAFRVRAWRGSRRAAIRRAYAGWPVIP